MKYELTHQHPTGGKVVQCGNHGQGLFAATAGSLRRLVNIVGCSPGAAADVPFIRSLPRLLSKSNEQRKRLLATPRVACAEVTVTMTNNRKCHLPLGVKEIQLGRE